MEARAAHDHGRRVGIADAEPGGVLVNDETLTIANEFTEVEVRRVDTRNGSRLLITAPKSGQSISLDALELEALTRQNTRTLEAMVGNMHGPLLPGEGPISCGTGWAASGPWWWAADLESAGPSSR